MTKQASSTKGIKAFSVIKEPNIYYPTAVHLIAFQKLEPQNKTLTSYETSWNPCSVSPFPTIQHHSQSTHKLTSYTILYQTHYFLHYMKLNSHQIFRCQCRRKSLHKDQQKSRRDHFKTRSILHIHLNDLCSCGWTKLRFEL